MADIQFVIFELEGQQYGIEMKCVNCINKIKDFKITKIPNTPVFVEGVINLRNKIIPMYNLRKRFRFNEDYCNRNSEILIADVGKMSLGFIVDEVIDIIKLQEGDIESTPDIITGLDGRYISSIGRVGDDMIIILDVRNILSENEKSQVQQLGEEKAV